jgi:hypothetical protein
MAVGGAARVPLGDLGSPERRADGAGEQPVDLPGFTSRGGLSPLASVSLPLGERLDLGFQLAGSALGLAIRRGFALGEQTRLLGGLAPYAGVMLMRDGQGGESAVGPRLGISTPWVFAVDVSGMYEAWAGARAGVEHARCQLEQDGSRLALRGTLFRLGTVVGLGIGFRRLHALLELAVDREWWWMGSDIEPAERAGFSLTPAFALRVRF